MGKCLLQPLRWWAESDPLGWHCFEVSENLGVTSVAPVLLWFHMQGVLAKVICEPYNLFAGNRQNPIRIKCILQGSKSFTGNPCNSCKETFAVCKFMQNISTIDEFYRHLKNEKVVSC